MKERGRSVVKILVAIVLYVAILVAGVTALRQVTGKSGKASRPAGSISVVATTFPGYDFARAIVGADNVKMLLKPGGEAHTYEPTPADIRTIQDSDLFIYAGGDSDVWVENLLKTIDRKRTTVIKLMDLVETKNEETVEGMEEDEGESGKPEADEHVWTSPKNAKAILQKLNATIDKIDKSDSGKYDQNAGKYEKQLDQLDADFRQIVGTAKRREIIVGDRFPLRYFVDEYGLKYYAAFPGCSEQTEASSETIAFLAKKVKEDKIPVVLKMELSKGNIATTIASETGAKVLEFNSAHNISQKDFDAGVTYADIMRRNEGVLREALN